MLRTLTRQTLAVAVAVAVVVSFVGAPVAAAAALDTESDDGLGSLSGASTSSDDDSSSDDRSLRSDDGDDSTDNDSTENDSDDDNKTDDGTDTDDGSTDDDTSDDGNSSDDGSTDNDSSSDDSSSDDRSLRSDDGDDSADNDSDDSSRDRSLRSDDGDDSTDNDSDERRTELVADAVNGTTEIVENTTEGLEDSTDSLEDDGVVETADDILDSVSEVAVDLTTIDLDNPFDGDDGDDTEQTYDDSARDSHHEPPTDDSTGDDTADTDEDDAATAAGTGDGDRPDPADPAGAGAAIGLGAVATAAALRGSPVVAGSKAATSGGVLSTLLEKVRPFVFPLRYSRYDDSDPLEHEARERVYEIVNETPGSYLSEVSEEADLPLSTTRHHIKVLEREDLVTGAKLHGKRRFYPAYAEGIELAAALNDDSTANIIDAIARIGAASVSDLADELGRDPSTISHHLQRLEDDGVITRERDGRAVVNKLSAEARTALEPEATPADEAGEVVAGGAD